MRQVTGKKQGGVGAFNAKPTMTDLRAKLKYQVSTTSITASGVVPIKGATKYPAEPTINFTREAWVKQCHLVHKCPMEVGWFALVDYDEADNSFTITELVIPNQEVTAAETDIGKEDLADAAMELIEAGKDTSKMYAWFHSHVNMGVSPSGQDEYQVEDFLEDLADQPEVPAFIRGIQNKKGDLKLDVYYVQHGIAYQNVDFNVIHDDDPQWLKDIEGEITTKVTAKTYNNYNQYGYGVAGGQRHAAGKSQGANAAANKNNRGYGGTGDWDYGGAYAQQGFQDYYDDYDKFNNIQDVAVGAAVDNTPPTLTPLEYDYMEYAEFEIVYQSPANVEVLLSPGGRLLVCDKSGEVYDYNDYTEVFGEVDCTQSTPALIL